MLELSPCNSSSRLNLRNLPTELGRKIGITGYRMAQKIFKFN